MWSNRGYKKIAVVVHTEAGHETYTDQEFDNSASELSANGSIDLSGNRVLHVPFNDVAFANGIVDSNAIWWKIGSAPNPNDQTVSFETEDNGDPDNQPVTDDQYESLRDWINNEVKAQCPDVQYLTGHNDIYSGHSCPAGRWYNSGRLWQLANDTGLTIITGHSKP